MTSDSDVPVKELAVVEIEPHSEAAIPASGDDRHARGGLASRLKAAEGLVQLGSRLSREIAKGPTREVEYLDGVAVVPIVGLAEHQNAGHWAAVGASLGLVRGLPDLALVVTLPDHPLVIATRRKVGDHVLVSAPAEAVQQAHTAIVHVKARPDAAKASGAEAGRTVSSRVFMDSSERA